MKGLGLPYDIPKSHDDIPEFHCSADFNLYWEHVRLLLRQQHEGEPMAINRIIRRHEVVFIGTDDIVKKFYLGGTFSDWSISLDKDSIGVVNGIKLTRGLNETQTDTVHP